MTSEAEEVIAADFDVTEWDPEPYEIEGSNSDLSRVRVTKLFDGLITGTSRAELLMAGNTRGAGYVASEVFTGTVDGKEGSMIIQHWGLAEGEAAASAGHIIPGSGTGDLEGIVGKATYSQDASGQHSLELRVYFRTEPVNGLPS
ncbi:DUF3224 domain-containing protein [Arthrobacter crystallopoietes]|jgi:hypothetical protein|uniref:DUF3224 domain-containing protein n=1 Tax=Crystallibacter crystallopoietes TaxID=37928 RepID=A0A1H1G8C7_9MICC|nr:DUF3224 domain-containing protein [Arthrobacter crystallopoietes]AUI52713.1 hypothetical protein AC20117_19850 [Arthrobacter crystallopoietes]QTG80357.1 DUF3224 domain-containing protein [Arthrobacter crystallopoietes]SDR09309.1 Protein of unknown function [Arthrobacter crystallopoietes]